MDLNENNISKFNLYMLMSLFTIVFMIIILTTFFLGNKKFETVKNNIETKYIENKKNDIKKKVNSINNLIKVHYETRNKILKEYLQNNVNNAYKIVENIYSENASTKTDKEILELIKTALRQIRFKDGRGYFFVDSWDGINILYPSAPEYENTNILNLQDSQGNFIVKDEYTLIKEKKEGFIVSHWPIPGESSNKSYEKLTFIKGFEPLNITIGLGEYLHYFNEDIKNDILIIINSLNKNANNADYIFIFDFISENIKNNRFLSHPSLDNDTTEDDDVPFFNIKEFLRTHNKDLLDNKGLFKSYNAYDLEDKKELAKTSYFLLNQSLNWVVGSGFYLNDLEKTILEEEKELKNITRNEVIVEVLMMFFFLTLLFVFILIINNKTNSIILNYKTKVKKREDELLISKEKLSEYTNIIEKSNIISKSDEKGIITYVSDNFCKITGYTKEELIGQNHNIIRHPDVDNLFFEDLWKTIQNKEVYFSVIKNLSKDKTTIYFQTTIASILDQDGNIIEYIATRFDITEEYNLKKALEKQNSELIKTKNSLNRAQEIAKMGSCEFNIKTKELLWSEELYNIFNQDISTYIPNIESFFEFISKDDTKYLFEYIDKIKSGHKEETSIYKINISNTIKYIQATSIVSEFDSKGNPLVISSILQDISKIIIQQNQIIENEKLLNQQSKMAIMGEMLGNIAHQWKQPLSIISMSNGLIHLNQEHKDFSTQEDINSAIENIDNSVKNLSETIDDFRNFFKPEKEKSYFKLDELFNKTYKLIISQFKNDNIEIIKEIEDIQLFGYPNELLQVLINILKNAKDELIKIESHRKRLLFIKIYKKDSYAIIKIKDNANGIQESILNKIFDAYFTTKENNEGTGIGLYMSKQIIESMNGEIKVSNASYVYENEEYTGAEFIINLHL